MLPAKPPRARDLLPLVDEYANRSPDKSTACQTVAKEIGVSVTVLRATAYGEGKKKPRRSLKCALSDREEELLEAVCVAYARQGIPLTIEEFFDLATIFVKKEEDRRFSRSFVTGFIKPHDTVLCCNTGKITLPARCLGTT